MKKENNFVIVDALRTPFCHGNKLKDIAPDDLLAPLFRELLKRNQLSPERVSGVITGTVLQDSRWTNISRMASQKAGIPPASIDYTLQANCNSSFMSLSTAMGEILQGHGDLFLIGGVEIMSRYGYRLKSRGPGFESSDEIIRALRENRESFLGENEFIHCLTEALTDTNNDLSMIEIGEIMANLYHISRKEQEEYTRRNLERAVRAVESGILDSYILPLERLPSDSYPLNRKRMLRRDDSFSRADLVFAEDSPFLSASELLEKHREHMNRLGITAIDPTVTMYTSSIPGDGAGALILTTEKRASELDLPIRLRIANWAKAGVDPVIMGIAPAYSTAKVLSPPPLAENAGEIDIWEIHEAFASQTLSVYKESREKLGYTWDQDKTNIYGGSLAYTHPLGATNIRLVCNILSAFDEDKSRLKALACGCAGGGLGVSFLFTR